MMPAGWRDPILVVLIREPTRLSGTILTPRTEPSYGPALIVEYELDRKKSYLIANEAMTEIAARGFALNPLVFAVFYSLAANDSQEVAQAFAAADGEDRRISQPEVHDIATRCILRRNDAAERMVEQFELVLKALSEKLARPLNTELEGAVKSLVVEVSGKSMPASVRKALVGVIRSAREVSDRDRAVVADVRRGVDDVAKLRSDLERAMAERDAAMNEARVDRLTGMANRRAFDETMEGLFGRLGSSTNTVSVVIVDIDHFKKVNDVHGHDFGDEVLREVALRLEMALLSSGRLFRLGGEEFCAILDGVDVLQARQIAERMRLAVSAHKIPRDAGELGIEVTVSCGATERRVSEGRESSLRRADQALYKAKQSGRNQVVAVR